MTDATGLPPPPPPSPYSAPAAPAPAARQTNTMALVSLVAGILGWTLVPFIGSVVAVVCGHMARAEIRRNPDTQEGDGLAVTGLVLGWLVIAMGILTVLAIVAIIVFFGGLAAFFASAGGG